MDGRPVMACCTWFSIESSPKTRIEEVTKSDQPLNDLVLNHDLQPVDDQDDVRFKSEHVPLREDFDCSEASLESDGDLDLSPE